MVLGALPTDDKVALEPIEVSIAGSAETELPGVSE